MEKIRLVRISKTFTWILILLASANAILGITFFVESVHNGNVDRESEGLVNAIFMIVQGAIFIAWGIINMRSRRYFIEWDETMINLFLPKTKQPESIRINDINTVILRLFEVELHLQESVRIIDLNSLKDEDIRKVKNKFEDIRNRTGKE
jgi:hypothetical protein